MVTRKDILAGIKKDLKIDKPLSESYVASEKSYDLNTELLSAKTKQTHIKLYKERIQALNEVSAELDTADREAANHNMSEFRTLKALEMRHRNSVMLHEMYFSNISDIRSEISYDSITYMKLAASFGTFDDWQWDFMACAASADEGWAVTVYDTFLRRYINVMIDGDSKHIPVGCFPIVVLDVWAHSYYKDYLDNKNGYIENMMRELRWDVIEERVQRAEMIAQVVK